LQAVYRPPCRPVLAGSDDHRRCQHRAIVVHRSRGSAKGRPSSGAAVIQGGDSENHVGGLAFAGLVLRCQCVAIIRHATGVSRSTVQRASEGARKSTLGLDESNPTGDQSPFGSNRRRIGRVLPADETASFQSRIIRIGSKTQLFGDTRQDKPTQVEASCVIASSRSRPLG
jgi:hypothetical protein